MQLDLRARRRTLPLLFAANALLLCLGWIMAFYTYPGLPQEMPLWLSFFGQTSILMKKSPVFFVYPFAQTFSVIGFWLLSGVKFPKKNFTKKKSGPSDEKMSNIFSNLKKEFVYLILIFFNLIFIHIQRSLILVAHDVEQGVSELYFYSLFGIILLFVPLYRIRLKLIFRGKRLDQ